MDVDERCEYDGGLHLGPREHVGDELGELGVTVDVFGIWGAGGGGATECEVYRFNGALHYIV